MLSDSDRLDIVIKVYIEMYLNALNDKLPQKQTNIYQRRLVTLLKRKRADSLEL